MRRIFLHIGYPKAGSSVLQTTLSASRGALRRHGFLFPPAPSGLHNAFVAQFHHAPETLFPYCDLAIPPANLRRRMRADFERLADHLDSADVDTAILSSESLIELRAEAVPLVRDWVMARTDQATIVCYVRDPISYASSLIQERIKQGQTLAEAQSFYPTGNFSVWIPPWVNAFGKDNVVVRSIERSGLVNGDMADDFAATIGYEGRLNRNVQYENRRLSQAAVLMLDAVNSLKGPLNSKSPELMFLWETPGERFTLEPEFLAQVSARAVPGLEYLGREWGITLAPTDKTGPATDPFNGEVRAFLARRLVQAHTSSAAQS